MRNQRERLLPFQGEFLAHDMTQGVALGYGVVGLSARLSAGHAPPHHSDIATEQRRKTATDLLGLQPAFPREHAATSFGHHHGIMSQMVTQCADGNALKGQHSVAQGKRSDTLGQPQSPTIALKGQKYKCGRNHEIDGNMMSKRCGRLLPFQGESFAHDMTQGVALGYGVVGLSARFSAEHAPPHHPDIITE